MSDAEADGFDPRHDAEEVLSSDDEMLTMGDIRRFVAAYESYAAT